MIRLSKIIFIFSLLPVFVYYFSSLSYATQEFTSSFTANYVVDDQGLTTVTQQISLQNKLSNIYASEYTLTIGSTQIHNVHASTAKNSLPVDITKDTNATNIHITFPEQDKVVGKDQTLTLTITYQNDDIAQKNGRVLEVNIPRLTNIDDIDNYTVTILVPKIFDAPTLVTPQPASQQTSSTHRILTFTKNQLGAKGISALFGTYQSFTFNLRYQLNNPMLTNVYSQIALPPDTAYQKIFYSSIEPAPISVTTDADGNWLADYQLAPKSDLEIKAIGTVILYLKPQADFPLPRADLDSYLKSQPFWPIDDPQISDLGKKLKTPETIYNFVVDSLKYNYARIDSDFQRLGAKAALSNPDNVICTEFTDLFVALARAAGIPSREVNGFAFTANPKLRPLSLQKDVLHAWPEYYDPAKQLFIPVDPTWGNTTQGIDYFSRLDLNHFAFVIHGQDSSQPWPAGSYKLPQTEGKDVNIQFASTLPTPDEQLTIDIKLPPRLIPGFPLTGELIIHNTGNTSLTKPQFTFSAPNLSIVEPQLISGTINATIPPYGKLNLPIKLKPKFWLTNNQTTIFITVNNAQKKFTITPFQLGLSFNKRFLFSLALGSIFAASAFFAGRLLVQRFLKSSSLRRQG